MTQKGPCKPGDMISIFDTHVRERKRITSVLYDLHLCSKAFIPLHTYHTPHTHTHASIIIITIYN